MKDVRTLAGGKLQEIMRSATVDPEVPGTFTEGEQFTASCWLRTDDGRYFQVHVTELHPTESDLAFYAAQKK